MMFREAGRRAADGGGSASDMRMPLQPVRPREHAGHVGADEVALDEMPGRVLQS